jgi:hypothetical protein
MKFSKSLPLLGLTAFSLFIYVLPDSTEPPKLEVATTAPTNPTLNSEPLVEEEKNEISTELPEHLKKEITVKASEPSQIFKIEKDNITFQTGKGEIKGHIHLQVIDNGWTRIAGETEHGTFTLNIRQDQVFGRILLPQTETAFEITTDKNGELLVIQRDINNIICRKKELAATKVSGATPITPDAIPQLSTRPNAKGMIYLIFGGITIQEPDWNGGNPVTAAPASVTSDEIREIVGRIAEDYAPFDIGVTTIESEYTKMAPNRRTRLIVTPTDTVAPGSGGVAFVDSWRDAGTQNSSTVPAWVFNSTLKSIAEAASHEAGHTLGLVHKGTGFFNSYYNGHGGELTNPTSWAPIMGSSYTKNITQWSKGEYANANNQDDELAIISRTGNGAGYRTEILTQNTFQFENKSFEVNNTLLNQNPQFYTFQTLGGSLTATLSPTFPTYTNFDGRLELLDSQKNIIGIADSVDAIGTSLSQRNLTAGTYTLAVYPSGTEQKPTGGYTTGYSSYSSLGNYKLAGTISDPILTPFFTMDNLTTGTFGKSFSLPIQFSSGTLTTIPTNLPNGISFNPNTNTLEGTPTTTGNFENTVVAKNSYGEAASTFTIQILEAVPTIAEILKNLTGVTTSSTAPWKGTYGTLPNGSKGIMLESGRVGNSQRSSLQFTIPPKSTLSFYWKISSESGRDGLICRLNGSTATDAISYKRLSTSGEADWTQVTIRSRVSGTQNIEIVYVKDKTITKGQDKGWITNVTVGNPPTFTSKPTRNIKGTSGTGTVTITANTTTTNLQWKKNGVPIQPLTSGTHTITGTTTTTLVITNPTPGDTGTYSLNAKNEFGTTTSSPCYVSVTGPPPKP